MGVFMLEAATPYHKSTRDEWVPKDLREVDTGRRGAGQWS
jgi:hypothetical protein